MKDTKITEVPFRDWEDEVPALLDWVYLGFEISWKFLGIKVRISGKKKWKVNSYCPEAKAGYFSGKNSVLNNKNTETRNIGTDYIFEG